MGSVRLRRRQRSFRAARSDARAAEAAGHTVAFAGRPWMVPKVEARVSPSSRPGPMSASHRSAASRSESTWSGTCAPSETASAAASRASAPPICSALRRVEARSSSARSSTSARWSSPSGSALPHATLLVIAAGRSCDRLSPRRSTRCAPSTACRPIPSSRCPAATSCSRRSRRAFAIPPSRCRRPRIRCVSRRRPLSRTRRRADDPLHARHRLQHGVGRSVPAGARGAARSPDRRHRDGRGAISIPPSSDRNLQTCRSSATCRSGAPAAL